MTIPICLALTIYIFGLREAVPYTSFISHPHFCHFATLRGLKKGHCIKLLDLNLTNKSKELNTDWQTEYLKSLKNKNTTPFDNLLFLKEVTDFRS